MAKYKLPLISLVLFTMTALAEAGLSKEQVYSLYNQANQDFRQANSAQNSQQAKRLYEKAILGFERIIEEEQIKNAKLYYNLANAYFLHGQLGKAILNYRRAIMLDDSDENIQKNLTFARSRRIDKINTATEKQVLQTLFFWHYDFSLKTKLLLTCILFGILCLCITAVIWLGRSGLLTTIIGIWGILVICFLTSVIIEHHNHANQTCGVIIAKEVVARQGDGINYSPSFKEPLHEGTEFQLLEDRPGWFHIQLPNGNDGWIPDKSAELI